jgi:hypothetical protein
VLFITSGTFDVTWGVVYCKRHLLSQLKIVYHTSWCEKRRHFGVWIFTLYYSGTCDCSIDKYWNESLCVPRLNEYQNCTSSCECIDNLICDPCISICLNNTYEPGWTYYDVKFCILIGKASYNKSVENCSSLLPSKSSKIVVINDQILMDFLICRFLSSFYRAFISDESIISCNSNHNCKTLNKNGC